MIAAAAWLAAAWCGADQPDGPFKGLKFRSIGPACGGRVCRVAGVPGTMARYAATASGGVWKSADGGLSWAPIADDECPSAGAIAVAPSDPNVLYVGAGEANIRNNVVAGDGLRKSADGGKTWTHVWKETGQIGALAVHHRNADVCFAAVLGHAFGPNDARGVYRTTDGGKSWVRVLFHDADTGAADVALDPGNPRVVFAGMWQARRRPWELRSGGPGSGLHVSRDGGDTWKRLSGDGLPKGPWGRVGVAVAPSDGRRVYAVIEAEAGGLFRSDDGGEKWRLACGERKLRQRAWYYSTLTVDPANPDVVWAPQVPLLKSIDGGKTFDAVKGPHHGDHHDVWIDPLQPRHMIAGNDGGIDVSFDGGATWHAPPLPWGQFYHLALDRSVPPRAAGALQDIGALSGPIDSLATGGIGPDDWRNIGGGEAGYVVHDARDPHIVFAGEYDGIFTRFDDRTGAARHVGRYPVDSSGHGAADKRWRFRWPAPAMGSVHDPKAVYHAGNVVFRTVDGGQAWAALGGDLTRNDRAKQQWSGGPITGDNTGAEHYGTVSALAESPLRAGVLWAGSDDGLLHVSQDGGKEWKNVSAGLDGLPEWATFAHLEPSLRVPGGAWAVADAHLLDDPKPYVWRTEDFGATWKRLGGLPPWPCHVLREDPQRPGLLFLGHDRGVHWSLDGGKSWRPLKLGLPNAPVRDLRIADGALVVATMGRSAWVLDCLDVLRAWDDGVLHEPLKLFPPAPATAWRLRSTSKRPGAGANPARGAALRYWLREKVPAAKLEIIDAQGTVLAEVRERDEEAEGEDGEPKYKPLPLEPGLHTVAWDLSERPPTRIPNARLDAGDVNVGPPALPGAYVVRLSVGKEVRTAPLEVRADPRAPVAAADRAAQHAFARSLRDDLDRLSRTVLRLRGLRAQLALRAKTLADVAAAKDFVAADRQRIGALDALEARLHNPKAKVSYDILAIKGGAKLYSQLASLYSFAMDGDGAPTQGMREVRDDYRKELDAALADAARADEPLRAANAEAAKNGWPTIYLPAP